VPQELNEIIHVDKRLQFTVDCVMEVDALTPLPFNFTLEEIKRETHDGLELNSSNQILALC
jgi:hypothetical protein